MSKQRILKDGGYSGIVEEGNWGKALIIPFTSNEIHTQSNARRPVLSLPEMTVTASSLFRNSGSHNSAHGVKPKFHYADFTATSATSPRQVKSSQGAF